MTMTVTVPYRKPSFGWEDWAFYPLQIEIGDRCTVCGGPRGEPRRVDEQEVDRWDNPCGHVDTYKKCLVEAGVVA